MHAYVKNVYSSVAGWIVLLFYLVYSVYFIYLLIFYIVLCNDECIKLNSPDFIIDMYFCLEYELIFFFFSYILISWLCFWGMYISNYYVFLMALPFDNKQCTSFFPITGSFWCIIYFFLYKCSLVSSLWLLLMLFYEIYIHTIISMKSIQSVVYRTITLLFIHHHDHF